MRKKIICLSLAAVLSLSGALPVCAEDHTGSGNWQVTFDGSKMNSNFRSAQIAEEAASIQPGDSIDLQVALRNSGSKDTDWYMTNEVLATLEDSQQTAEGGAYSYRLSYEAPGGGEDVLYDSQSVGGEGDSNKAGEGLYQATGSLKDYFFLDTLANGQSGTVHLNIKLDGESQGNDYQDTLAALQMNFAVEEVERGAVTVTVTPTPISRTNTVRRTLEQSSPNLIPLAVQTGDPTQILPWCLAALAAGVVFLILGAAAMKRRRGDSEEEGGSQE